MAANTATPAARCKNVRRGSFIRPLRSGAVGQSTICCPVQRTSGSLPLDIRFADYPDILLGLLAQMGCEVGRRLADWIEPLHGPLGLKVWRQHGGIAPLRK